MKPHKMTAQDAQNAQGHIHTPRTKRTHPFRGVRMCGCGVCAGSGMCGTSRAAVAQGRR
jgi:hypothetical protein